MRYIDAFCHFFPKRLWDKMATMAGTAKDIGARMRGVPASTTSMSGSASATCSAASTTTPR